MVIQRPGQVTSHRLLHRRLVHDGMRLDKATLFPMFHNSGAVEDVLVVDAHSAELYLIPLTYCSVRAGRWGPVVVNGSLEALTRHSVERIEDLWHFDPWWLLAEKRFDALEVTPLLKATNCVEKFRWRAKRVAGADCRKRQRARVRERPRE